MSLLLAIMATPKGPLAHITNQTRTGNDTSVPYNAQAGWRANSNGNAEAGVNPSGGGILVWNAISGQWLVRGSAVEFEVQATEVSQSGTATRSGEIGVFRNLSVTRSWTLVTTTAGFKSWVLDITIREAADTSNSVTGRMTLNVEGVI